MSSVTYLGLEVSANGIKPGQGKVEAIKRFPVPKNVHEIRRFLGLTGFFRRFVPRYAEIAAPLSGLLKSDREFIWSREVSDAFTALRDKLVERPILQPFNSKKRTELHTDASSRGLAAMLLQEGSDSKMHLVYAISRTTNETEKFYHSSKLELLAIIWAVSRLRTLLININFTIITDCQALVYLNTQRTKNAQIVRWHHLLSEFDYEIVHREGAKLAHVDALSRAPMEYEFDKDPVDDSAIMSIWETNRNENCEIGVFIIIDDNQEILAFQFRDEEIEAKRKILNKPASQRSRDEKESVKDFEISSGVLYKRIGDKLRYVVPKCMRKSLAVRYHDYGGHQGVARTFELMSRRYYFAGMRRYIKQHVHSCFHCLASKTRPGRQLGELHPIPPGKRPFHTIHIDHVGPFVRSSRGNKFVFVLIDNLTKFVILVAMRDTKTANVVKSLEQFVCDFGAPVRIISDRGTCFTSKNFRRVL
ncbi:unnamed protein product [Trichogramma brassicae]|uniref:RNA-directed DNA polymerase n=1 Tax=Trichogramma brassicae TaxID=86971 RepID=A0A6H5IR69_9HYME|nr:unnamed protein product [Trichogramma brassicae]